MAGYPCSPARCAAEREASDRRDDEFFARWEWDNREEASSLQAHAEEAHPALDEFRRVLRVGFYRTWLCRRLRERRKR
jgi:hypothetical protein